MLEIFGKNLADSVALGVGPEVGIEPSHAIGRHAAKRGPEDMLVRKEQWKLDHVFLDLTGGGFMSHQGRRASALSGCHTYKLEERLMGDAQVAGRCAAAEQAGGGRALFRVARVATVNQNISIDEGGHGAVRTVLREPSRDSGA